MSEMTGEGFMIRFIEWARGHVSSNGKLRYALYCGFIDELEKMGLEVPESLSFMDDQYKEAWRDMHESEEEEEV